MPFRNPHPLYQTWQNIRAKCRNPNNPQWKDYGGRGIRVCPEWDNDFSRFAADMGARPEGYTIERLDNDGPYSPGNCVWADRHAQMRNQRKTIFIEIEGRRYCLRDLADQAGRASSTILERAKAGLSYNEVMSPENRKPNWPQLVTHCPKGHSYDEANTILTKAGTRQCRICSRERSKAWKARADYAGQRRAARRAKRMAPD